MEDPWQALAASAGDLAEKVPFSVVEALSAALRRSVPPGAASAWKGFVHGLPNPQYRKAAADFVERWQSLIPELPVQVVAMALSTAALSRQRHDAHEQIELVWTGPEIQGGPFRRTEQAIQEVLDAARTRLTVVSYAVFRIPRIRDALIRAAERGVAIRLILETPNLIEGKSDYDSLRALGGAIASVADIYFWPQERRATDENGKTGSLHVKCAVADGHTLFMSSANLTEYAFTINMELGLLVAGGRLPARVEEHFDRLVAKGVLIPIT